MSNETDLDWLARNVHVWPVGEHQAWCYVVTRIDGVKEWAGNVIVCSFPYTKIERKQWLARRAELQNKPSWDDAPAQATCMAQEPRGVWTFFACQPPSSSPVHDTWWRLDGFQAWSSHMRGEVLGDWRDTLEKRPEQAAFAPFVSTEDSQEKDMTQQQETKQDNGWHERGELPPVGTRCVALLGIAPKANCEVIAKTEQQMVVKWEENGMMDVIDLDAHVAFRPIRTERDVMIEVILSCGSMSEGVLADAILAAGFKRGAA